MAEYRSSTAPLIGILGYARAGKDSVAARLIEEHGFVRYAFADSLKATMLDLDPLVTGPLDPWGAPGIRLSEVVGEIGWEQAKGMPEVRRLLQAHGVAIRNHVGEDTWVNAVMSKVDAEDRPVVITDVRFPNEVDAIEARGGWLVRILRPGAEGDTHISETALADTPVDFVVHNVGSLTDLNVAVDHLARRVSPLETRT